MKLRLEKATRLPHWPLWAVALAAGMILMTGLVHHIDPGHTQCAFKRMTHLPCPTCGTTRLGLALLRGDVWTAVRMNPLVFVGSTVIAAALLLRLCTGRKIVIEASPGRRGLVWALVAGVLLVNWMYVILYVG